MKRKLQVFVSSTYEDLKAERQAAVEAILRAGHIPAGMELFAADDRSQMEVIRKWIEESDVYLLILGGRYGSVDPETGKSYTQLEYEYALELEKPLFAVVMSKALLETRRVQKSGYETQRLDEYFAFRELVLSKMSRFFDDEKDIKLTIHESLGTFLNSREFTGGWVSAKEVSEPKPLIDEIARLNEENRRLREEAGRLREAERKAAAKNGEDSQISEIIKALGREEIDVPAELTKDGKAFRAPVLGLVQTLKDTLIVGVANSVGMSASGEFIFFKLAPKLAMHGLMQRKRASGGKYDNFATTPLGNRVLAEITRRTHAAKSSEEEERRKRTEEAGKADKARTLARPSTDVESSPKREATGKRPIRRTKRPRSDE